MIIDVLLTFYLGEIMELEQFLERNMLFFLDSKTEKKSRGSSDSEEEYGLYLTRDYISELTRALDRDELSKAKRIFDDLKDYYNKLPEDSLERKKIYVLLEQMYSKIEEYVHLRDAFGGPKMLFVGDNPKSMVLGCSRGDKLSSSHVGPQFEKILNADSGFANSSLSGVDVSGSDLLSKGFNLKDLTQERLKQEMLINAQLQNNITSLMQSEKRSSSFKDDDAVQKDEASDADNIFFRDKKFNASLDDSFNDDMYKENISKQKNQKKILESAESLESDIASKRSALDSELASKRLALSSELASKRAAFESEMASKHAALSSESVSKNTAPKSEIAARHYTEQASKPSPKPVHKIDVPAMDDASDSFDLEKEMSRHKANLLSRRNQARADAWNYDESKEYVDIDRELRLSKDRMDSVHKKKQWSLSNSSIVEELYSQGLYMIFHNNYVEASRIFGKILELKPSHKAARIRLQQCSEAV